MNKKYICGCLALLLIICDWGWTARPAAAANVNVALNKPVSVSSEYQEYGSKKEHLVDGSPDTHWMAKAATSADSPQWVMVDLQEAYALSGAEVTWKDSDVVVRYAVETSVDGETWTKQVDRTDNDHAESTASLEFQASGARYVKVSMPFYKETGAWAAISELQIWGQEEGTEPADITSYDSVSVSTLRRVTPELPKEVNAHYSNGRRAAVPVDWAAIDPGQYDAAGSFTVTGTVYGASVQPSATVTVQQYRDDYARGVDISTLTAIEDNGGTYVDSDGTKRDLLDILKDRGVNYVRLRLWNDPQKSNGYNDKQDVIRMASRVKAKGMKLLVDFHYSDEWAHPGQQIRPKAWENLSFEELKSAVREYTQKVVSELKAAGAMPDMVQIGNEINSGVLNGLNSNVNFDENAALLNSGIAGVRDVEGGDQVRIMIHLAEGGKSEMFDWYFGELEKGNVDYDTVGLSYYPFWHGTFADVQATMNLIAEKYGKDVIIAETSYPFSFKNGDAHGNIIGTPESLHVGGATFPATVQGQYDVIAGIMDMIAKVPGNKGAGFFYWEPAWIAADVGWIASEGDAWENQAMFDYDEYPGNGGYSYEGRALDSLDVYKRGIAIEPANRQRLWAAISRAEALVESDFEAESWKTLAPAIEQARQVYEQAYANTGLTQAASDAAAQALEEVMLHMEVIPADLTALQAKIEEARTYKEADWSAATWAVLAKALEQAERVWADPRSTQTEVNAAAEKLDKAIQGLSDVDKTALTIRIGEVQQLAESSYTKRSWHALRTALQAAIAVRDKADAIQAEVSQSLADLERAAEGLISLEALTTGKTAEASSSAGTGGGQANSPGGAIDGNPNTSWGTDQSVGSWWQVDLGQTAVLRKIEMSMWSGGIKYRIDVSDDNEHFTTVIDTTSDVVVSTSPRHVLPEGTKGRYIRVTVTAGSTWVGFLDFEAYGVFPADSSALASTVDAVKSLRQSDYTRESWSGLTQALDLAHTLLADEETSSAELAAANDALSRAINGLVKQPQTTDPGTGTGTGGTTQPSQPGTSGSGNHGDAAHEGTIPNIAETGNDPRGSSMTIQGTLTQGVEYVVQPTPGQVAQQVKALGSGQKSLTLIADVPDSAEAVTFKLDAGQFAGWVRSESLQVLELSFKQTRVRVYLEDLESLKGNVSGALEIRVGGMPSDATDEQQAAMKSGREIVQLRLSVNGEPVAWTNRGIEVLLEELSGPSADHRVLIMQTLRDNGKLKPILFSHYDAAGKRFAFKPNEQGTFVLTEIAVPFNDIQQHAWALNEVGELYGKGVVSGMTGDSFKPQEALTRAQFLQLLTGALADMNHEKESILLPADVNEDAWYAEAVRRGMQMGIVTGKADGTFGANEPVTREQMAVMLQRALQAMHGGEAANASAAATSRFSDDESISAYAKQAVAAMQDLGLLQGMADGRFEPQGTTSRAQGAVVAARMLRQLY
ncbi:glycosyl hydrolase 53 family protein [Paenibacillus sp. FSL W8-0426]|uniref:glycosyl hydrolase 53 family protein n=1 Tax=Paenibacillus sp. FSL W8-0426 TaxID=2921714 RepID=UPI0030DA88BE